MPIRARIALTLFLGAAALHVVPAGAASSIACSSTGLKAHHGTSKNHVTKLKAKGTTCAAARKVAQDYAQAMTEVGPGGEIPSKVDGYRVDFTICDDEERVCPNADDIVATRSGRRITFTLVYDHFS